jgi:hypothetical protein
MRLHDIKSITEFLSVDDAIYCGFYVVEASHPGSEARNSPV